MELETTSQQSSSPKSTVFRDTVSEKSVSSIESNLSSSSLSFANSWKYAMQLLTGTPNKLSKDVLLYNNCPLRFLILLREDDYKKWFCGSRYTRLKSKSSKFPGKLVIEKFSEAESLPYNIEEPPIPRKLYIMLPKEKLFIPLEKFTGRYIDSKMQELKTIFVSLRAKTIKMKRVFDTSSSMRTGGKVEISEWNKLLGNNVTFGSDAIIENVDHNRIVVTSEMRFDNPFEELESTKDIVDQLSVITCDREKHLFRYYYLAKEFEWQNIIDRRLKNKMVFDRYTYHNTEQKLFSTKFLNSLRLLDISVEYDWKKIQNLQIHYEIEYYPLPTVPDTLIEPCRLL